MFEDSFFPPEFDDESSVVTSIEASMGIFVILVGVPRFLQT
jgi:hypothetical protein